MKLLTISLIVLSFCISLSYGQAPASYGVCAACHGPDGKGINTGGPVQMAPALAGSKLLTAGDGEIAASLILTGILKEDSKYLGMMASFGETIKDDDMATLLTYLRSNFGNSASAVTADQVKAWREKYKGKPMQKRAELYKLADAASAPASAGEAPQPPPQETPQPPPPETPQQPAQQ